MYAVKEVCRGMARPTRGQWHTLKRLGRYLVDNRRTVTRYDWQGHESEVTGYSDSDWAGCRVTGKSTSGGVIMIGGHFIKWVVQNPEPRDPQFRGGRTHSTGKVLGRVVGDQKCDE